MRFILFFLVLAVNVFSTESPTYLNLRDYLTKNKVRVTEGSISGPEETWLVQFLKKHPNFTSIAEIGFNVGYSAEIFLKHCPKAKVVSFDIGKHEYLKDGKKYLDMTYPDRLSLVFGDSKKTVNKYANQNKGEKFNFIFIDGSHEYLTAYLDIKNMKKFARKNTYVMIDDLQILKVRDAYNRCCKEGILTNCKVYKMGWRSWAIGKYHFR